MRRFVARLRQAPAGTLTTPLTPRSPMPPPPATPPPRPLVALVVSAMRDEEEGNTTLMRAMTSQGKPNTGKSTLFNRLVGRNRALVSATPGTTRDRLFGTMEWLDHSIDVVDTGGMYQDKEDYFASEVMEQAQLALDEAHMVVMVVDGRAPLDDKDRRVARLLQKRLSTRPVALAVNKIDNDGFLHEVTEKRGASFRNLGLGEPYYVSALHAEGTSELLADIFRQLAPSTAPADRKAERLKMKELSKRPKKLLAADGSEEVDDAALVAREKWPLRIAVVGNPNSGKSTLVNSIISKSGSDVEARSITSPIAGTTHDTIDTALNWRGTNVVLLDTAGIARRAQRQRAGLERSSVLWALKTISTADVNVLTLDASKGVTANEKRIAGAILDSKSSVLVVVNKSDLLLSEKGTKEAYEKEVRNELKFLPWVPIVFVSALEGRNVGAVVDMAVRVHTERLARIPTRQLWDMVQRAQLRRPPPSKGHLRLKISFVTQAKTTTPTFVFFVNEPALVHFTYERFLENALRESFPFSGSPVKLVFKKKEGHVKYLRQPRNY